jgi:predicted ATPase
MEGKRTIQSIRLKNLLSFGSEGEQIELQSLNVLIGPNASGKSNFIEVLRLMSSLPRNIGSPISDGGGINEWLWKGGEPNPVAEIETLFAYPHDDLSLRHCLKFTGENNFAKIVYETISRENLVKPEEISYSYQNVEGRVSWRKSTHNFNHQGQPVTSVHVDLDSAVADNQSILQQRKEPQLYPELYYLTELLPTFRLYDDFDVRRYSKLRLGQDPALPGDFLEPNGSNLGAVFINLPGSIQDEINVKLKNITPVVEEAKPRLGGGIIQFLLREQGLYSPTPPIRLSGGTLRYLCLLTILLHPTPPPLISLEEPEIGLHPDVIHTVAELLIEASQRTQLIVTTHSDLLVSALANFDATDAVIVCERDREGTKLRRLEAERLKEWLEMYSLGDLWLKGELGGTRW